DAGAERQQLARLLLFDQLPIDQIGMWCTDGLAWAAPLPSGCKRHHNVEGGDERRQITRQSIAEEPADPRHTGLGGRHDLLGRLERTRSYHSRDHQPQLRSKTAPDPLAPVLAFGHTFTRLVRPPTVL